MPQKAISERYYSSEKPLNSTKGKLRALFLSRKVYKPFTSPPIWMVVWHFLAENELSFLKAGHWMQLLNAVLC